MSARLFACVYLLFNQCCESIELMKPLLPLFNAFVNAEYSSLLDTKPVTKSTRRKKVKFSSIDNSSMITPIDIEKDSELVIESCISTLDMILQEIVKLPSQVRCHNVQALVTALEEISSGRKSNEILAECSKVGLT